jgi:hypothetical protein
MTDSTTLAEDRAALRARIAARHYLVFRQLLDPAVLTSLRGELLEVMRGWGWLAEGTDPAAAVPRQIRQEGGAGWWRPYADLQRVEAFHRLSHDPQLTAALRSLIADDLLPHGRRIVSLIYPGFHVPSHQDFSYVQGTVDFFSVWIPLDPHPGETGRLRIYPEIDPHKLRPLRQTRTRGVTTDVPDDDPRWQEIELALGDVAVYHSLTVHAVSPNRSERIAVACEYRYQSARDPICEASVQPHHYPRLPGWPDLVKGWSTKQWVRTPRRLRRVPYLMPHSFDTWHEEVPVPDSRFIPAGSPAGGAQLPTAR